MTKQLKTLLFLQLIMYTQFFSSLCLNIELLDVAYDF